MERKIKIMFVDDEVKFLDNMTTRLRLRGLDVMSFTDGITALEAVRKGADIDVALLDLKMPGIDGEELLNRLKRIDPSIEVIILTGHGSIKSAADLTRSGAYEYLLKPCELDDVISAISSAFAKRVKAKNESKTKRVNDILEKAVGMSPIELLNELKRINEE
jgi:DNA-binding NtrC family response regulator